MDGLLSHYVLDGGRLVVAHAGLPEEMHGRASAAVRSFALYGETTGETDEYGLPVRYPWAQDYRGRAMVVYGHTPVPEAEWLNNTICVDTGCVFGGQLTALRYPERELVSVPAEQVYHQPARPLGTGYGGPAAGPAQGGPATAGPPGDVALDTWPGDRDPAARPGDGPGGERGRRAGGDEPVRGQPAVAGVPAADDGAGAREHPAPAFSSTRLTPSTTTAARAWPAWCARRSTWAPARSPWSAAPGRRPATGSGSPMTRPAWSHPDRPPVLRPPGPGGRAAGQAPRRADRHRAVGRAWATGRLLDGEILPWSLKAAELIRTNYAAAGAAAGTIAGRLGAGRPPRRPGG